MANFIPHKKDRKYFNNADDPHGGGDVKRVFSVRDLFFGDGCHTWQEVMSLHMLFLMAARSSGFIVITGIA